VTSEISGLLKRAFGDGEEGLQPDDVRITNAQLSAHADPEAGETLAPGVVLNGRFEIVRLAHLGGMSTVYKAIDHRRHIAAPDQHFVAIKVMRRTLASPEMLRAAVEREASRGQALAHPNIVNVFDFDQYEDHYYLVMEWLEGETVNDLLRRTNGERLATEFAWRLVEEAAAGLHHAHVNNVVHADVNPSNIFITATHRIKLIDFGVARECDEADVEGSDERFPWVTQPYASPQVLTGRAPVFEDDVFSLACVAYRLLGGSHPFGGSPSILARQRGDTVKPIAGLSASDWEFLRSALSYERGDRPTSLTPILRNARRAGVPANNGYRAARRWLSLPLAVAAGAVVALIGNQWLSRAAPEPALEPATQSQNTGQSAVPGVPSDTENRAVDETLARATLALEQQRYVAPAEGNARDDYRAVLAMQPGNSAALQGLRSISDIFVQQAELAVQSDDPERAYEALAVARETDPDNPAIGVVDGLLAATGDKALADARVAMTAGDTARALDLLAYAQRFDHIDASAVSSVRSEIAAMEADRVFEGKLAAADEHIVAGRLISPEGDNARDVLMEVDSQYGGDPRLQVAQERLAARLLTRAALATTAGQFVEAGMLLDAVDALGVLEPELAAARASLEAAGRQATPAVASGATVPEAKPREDESTGPAAVTSAAAAAAIAATTGEPVSGRETADGRAASSPEVAVPAAERADEPAPAAAGADIGKTPPAVGGESMPEAHTAAQPNELPSGMAAASVAVPERQATGATENAAVVPAGEPEPPRPASLDDLGLEEFIPPKVPRRARRQGISGFVEVGFVVNQDGSTGDIEVLKAEPGNVFESSAVRAVEQWHFAKRDDNYRASVILRFSLEP